MTTKQYSKASNYRRAVKQSPAMQAFKNKILMFLSITNASDAIVYHMIQDLSRMTSMPFYGETRNYGIKNKMCSNIVIKSYCELFVYYYQKTHDIDFIKEIIKWLSRQQNQHFRKLSKIHPQQKAKKKVLESMGQSGVFEHPIPVSYSKSVLIQYIQTEDLGRINKYIDFIWENTYQVFLETTLDQTVNATYSDTMPANWNWEDTSNNYPFQRYVSVGIPSSEYL